MKKIKPRLLIFCLGFILLFFLLRGYILELNNEDFYHQSIQILSKTIAIDNERYGIAMQNIMEDSYNITKSRSWPLLLKIRNIDRTRLEFNELVAQINQEKSITTQQRRQFLQELEKVAIKQDQTLLEDFKKMLLDNYEVLGLQTKEEALIVLKREEETYKNMKEQHPLINQSGIKNDAFFTLKVLLFQASRLQQIKFFEDLFLNYLHGKRMCNWGEGRLFPLIHPIKNCVAQGEFYEAEIGIGTYYADIDPNLVEIIVEGDTLPIDLESGTAKFKRKASKKGTVELAVTCRTVNPLTGEPSIVRNMILYDVH